MKPAERARHGEQLDRAAPLVLDPTLVIWLDAPPEELENRVQQRGREFETPVRREFLAALQAGYSRVLTEPAAPPLYRPQSTTTQELVLELQVVASAISG